MTYNERTVGLPGVVVGDPGVRDFSGTRLESRQVAGGYRVYAWPQEEPQAFVFDLDGTLYNNDDYRRDVAERETLALAEQMGWSVEETPDLLKQLRNAYSQELGRNARISETMAYINLGAWWDEARRRVYRPAQFITPNPSVADVLTRVSQQRRVAVATNSPAEIGSRIVRLLGVPEETMARITFVGPDTLGVAKPNPEYFHAVAARLGVAPEATISIGDDEENDIFPAIEAGMGAVQVTRVGHIGAFVARAHEQHQYEPFSMGDYAQAVFRPGDITVVGFTGRAGAGKTHSARAFAEMCTEAGIPAAVLGLDSFFIQSSKGRKAWLEEGKAIGPEEFAKRADQHTWWDFDKTARSLATLKSGRALHLENVYNRQDGGELTGTVHIEPDKRGQVVVLEGVAIAHFRPMLDELVYINAHPKVRQERLLGRDAHRASEAAQERFQITQAFEGRYFQQYEGHVDHVVDNSNGRLFKLPAIAHY